MCETEKQMFKPGDVVFTWYSTSKRKMVVTKHRITTVAASHRRTNHYHLPDYCGQSPYGYTINPPFSKDGGWIDQAWFSSSQQEAKGAALALMDK
ncbi:MAG: hypothetical protein PHE17_19565 [Thiothrix sp.]|uniref:hypothetical protein n=1 Tax=Thiothrix sp. TaxID=1032 RepID=UPI00261F43F7|nr:hypothetical protein [Thiothrix sp.]MDD5395227.1 hypothetical protein [Thiothrix sp.]